MPTDKRKADCPPPGYRWVAERRKGKDGRAKKARLKAKEKQRRYKR